MANRRYIDFPIASSVGDSDIILIWQSGANKQTTKATFLSGLPENLDELNDVAISGLTNGQILRYDSVTGKWENTYQGNLDLNDLNDVSIVSPSNGQVLVYNSSTSKWENSSGGYVPYTGAVTTVNLGAQTIQAGSFVKAGGTAAQFLKADGSVDSNVYGTGTVTSVALTMPTAFSVANSPITTAGTLAVTGAGTVGQYIRGDGSLADFPESSGGGSSVSYYLNGSVAQGTIGGVAYKELNKVPILGAGTDFTINADGYIASFITDAGDPNLLEIPAGNWNFETYFSASSGGGSPTFYVELYKVNSGGTATLIASNSGFPELIAFGTNIISYFSTLAVPTTALALTDRLAIRYYVTHSGRTITLHTEDNHLCQIITTFTTGLTALNGLTAQIQNFAVGTSGTDFAIASATATHTFNLPTASATNRGALSSADWSMFNGKQNALTNPVTGTGTTNYLAKFTGSTTIGNSTLQEVSGNLGLGVNPSSWSQFKALEIGTIGNGISGFIGASSTVMHTNAYWNGTNWIYANTANSAQIEIQGGNIIAFKQAASGTGGNVITYTQPITLFSGGNLLLSNGAISDNGSKLQVVGSATFSGSTAINLTGNGGFFNAANKFGLDHFSGASRFYSNGANISTKGAFEFHINNSDGSLDDIALGISNTGSATFSSSITAGASISIGSSGPYVPGVLFSDANWGMILKAKQASPVNANFMLTSATDVEQMRFYPDGNLHIGPTASNNGARFQVSGTATVSGNITIGQATASTNVKLILNGVASKAAGIEFHQSGTPQWYIGNGIASEDNNFELYNSNGTMAMKIIKSTNAINFIGAATFSGDVTISKTSPTFRLTRGNTSSSSLVVYNTNGTDNWLVGTGVTGSNTDYRVYNNSLGADAIYILNSNNNVLIGTTTNNGPRLQVAASSSTWISGTFAGTGGTNKVVIGNYEGAASIGAHSAALDAWANLAINFGGGNVLIGTTTSGASKLRIVGLPTSAAGLSSGDVYNLSGVLMIA
jgi:hypothetical protein